MFAVAWTTDTLAAVVALLVVAGVALARAVLDLRDRVATIEGRLEDPGGRRRTR